MIFHKNEAGKRSYWLDLASTTTREQQGATMAVSPHQQVILKQQQNQQSHHRPPAIRIRNPLELVDLSGPTFQQQQEKPRVMPGEIAEVNAIGCQPAFARKRALSAEGNVQLLGKFLGKSPLDTSEGAQAIKYSIRRAL